MKNKDNTVEGLFSTIYRVPKETAISEVFRVKADCEYGRLYQSKPILFDVNGRDIEAEVVGRTIHFDQWRDRSEQLQKERTYLEAVPAFTSGSLNSFLLKGLCGK